MLKEERRLKKEIKALLAQAEEADQAEDSTYGRDRRGEELPEELARRGSRLDKIRQAKAQYNFTDPESQIMKVSNKGWDQCINTQVAVNEHQIIIAADVTDDAND